VFSLLELEAVRSGRGPPPPVGGVVLCTGGCRRSGSGGEGDLDRQLARLWQAVRGRIVVAELWNVSSGLSDQRRGLRRALEACQRPRVPVLLVEREQRLARFGVGVLRDVTLPAFTCVKQVVG
jgi:putative resolvase